MLVVRQADDPFVFFGAKPDKGSGHEISTRPEVGRERQSGVGRRNPDSSVVDQIRWLAVGQRNSEKAVLDGRRRVAVGVDTGQQKWPVGMR